MATTQAGSSHHYHFKVLEKYFSDREQDRLVHEDLTAGVSVCGILTSVVTLGTLAGAIAVAAIIFLL